MQTLMGMLCATAATKPSHSYVCKAKAACETCEPGRRMAEKLSHFKVYDDTTVLAFS